jgi:hypothetical protein
MFSCALAVYHMHGLGHVSMCMGPFVHMHVVIHEGVPRGHLSMFTEPRIHMYMIMLLRYQRACDRLQKLHSPRVP